MIGGELGMVELRMRFGGMGVTCGCISRDY